MTKILLSCLQRSLLDLILLNGLKQRLEIALAEAFVALALDDLEENRADDGGGENLQ